MNLPEIISELDPLGQKHWKGPDRHMRLVISNLVSETKGVKERAYLFNSFRRLLSKACSKSLTKFIRKLIAHVYYEATRNYSSVTALVRFLDRTRVSIP